MGDPRAKMLWDRNADSAEPPLRRPRGPSNPAHTRNSNNQNLQDPGRNLVMSSSFNSSDDILAKTNLSVDAQEFFPASYNRHPTPDSGSMSGTHSVQNRLHKYKQPEPQIPVNHLDAFYDPTSDLPYDETSNDLSKLQLIICTLIEDPGQFNELIGTFIETLGPYYEDLDMVTATTNLIFSQALQEPNLRYNAARLCYKIEEQCPLFRSNLHALCEKNLKENSFDASLTLFLAELYAQLNYENLYGKYLMESLRCVVSQRDGSNIKAVCQVLKLAGSSLDTYNKAAVDEIFRQLDNVRQVVPNNIVNLINSVVTLRATNWGQNQSSPTASNNRYPNEGSSTSYDGPIFYGPDGQELTNEENKFLTDGCSYQADFMTDDSDPETLWDPDPEMDEEMQAAFRQFIQLSK